MKKHSPFLMLLAFFIALQPNFAQPASEQQPASDTLDTKLYSALKWRNIGPFRGGRSNTVSGVRQDENSYYAGYTGGGVWKTEDAGNTWKNISDKFFKTGSVGDIAVSESDPNVIYVGMGEHAVRGVMTSYGDGIYKSVDAGETWQHMGLEKTRHISDVIIHPDDPDVVYVAAQGTVHGPSEDRGIYKSTDGGTTWRKTLFVDEHSGASSLSMDFTNPRILYAATWQHQRYPWKVESGGPGSSIWKSTDSGETWKKTENGLPSEMGKIGVSVSRANPSRVFAIVESEKAKAGLYRSDNGGGKWAHLSSDQSITSRSWYYMEVFADPVNADVVYVLNAPMMRSIDGGKTFEQVSVGHGDTHDLWINPNNNRNMVLGDDGGAEVTFNTGRSWSTLYNQPTAQFYRVNADNQFPYWVYGGQQDNSSVAIASRTSGAGITEKDWFDGPGCESAFVAFDPANPILLYGGCYQGLISVLDTRTQESKDIMQYPSLKLAVEPKNMKYRYNWNAPIITSPHDPSVVYHAGNVLFKTTDGGMSWSPISPDLTRNDTTKQAEGGGPFTNEGAGGENYNTISYVIESSLEEGVIYTGSDCGLVYLTKDGGENWTNVTPEGLPECLIHSIEVSPHNAGTAYVGATRYKLNDYAAMVYKTTDYGASWTKITDGIDADDFIKVVREDPKTPGLLYGGAERGFYISYNGGTRWDRLQLNLPVVPINDLIIRDNDLVAATQGRAFWILDDLSPLQQFNENIEKERVFLFGPKPAVLFGSSRRTRTSTYGQNPETGVTLTYYLAEKVDSAEITLDILNSAGMVIRSYTNQKDDKFKSYPGGPPAAEVVPAKKGLNRFTWDFRTETLPDVPDVFIYGNYQGHRIAPGAYRARLSYEGRTSEVAIEVKPDPRLNIAPAEWQEQQQMLERIAGQISDIHGAINDMRRLKKQIGMYNDFMADMEGKEGLVEAGEELVAKIDAWESQVVEGRQKNTQDVINWPSKLNAEFFTLRSKIDSHDPRIPQGVKDRMADLEAKWNTYHKGMKDLLENEVKAYNALFRQEQVPALMVEMGE